MIEAIVRMVLCRKTRTYDPRSRRWIEKEIQEVADVTLMWLDAVE